MLFGYILMRPLLVLIRIFGRLREASDGASPGFSTQVPSPSTS
ncbi:hypothetical protein [Streptomyces sp. NPDC059262]